MQLAKATLKKRIAFRRAIAGFMARGPFFRVRNAKAFRPRSSRWISPSFFRASSSQRRQSHVVGPDGDPSLPDAWLRTTRAGAASCSAFKTPLESAPHDQDMWNIFLAQGSVKSSTLILRSGCANAHRCRNNLVNFLEVADFDLSSGLISRGAAKQQGACGFASRSRKPRQTLSPQVPARNTFYAPNHSNNYATSYTAVSNLLYLKNDSHLIYIGETASLFYPAISALKIQLLFDRRHARFGAGFVRVAARSTGDADRANHGACGVNRDAAADHHDVRQIA